ncbi:6-phosphofructokinase [hydrothermal vent metagenome]|uniref:6-phosphofructokinase n=1 Tax=hydrothermal vent metagenome TaxID=652676 RepID=A0A3B1DFZ2_9ZZZZ
MKKIGVLTGGADCPGMNAVIRGVVRKSMQEGYVVTGIKNGWQGIINNDMRILDLRITSGILDRGGTILGTSRMVSPLGDDVMETLAENFKRSGMDAIVAVGGENTLRIALDCYKKKGIPLVGVPKSIDNALSGTDYAFGFDTAVNVATACIDRLHTTAESHHRIIVIEVMGRHTGWIALESGIAGGAHITLIPEEPIDIEEISAVLKSRHKRGKNFTIVVVSEGAHILGYSTEVKATREHSEDIEAVSIGKLLGTLIRKETGYDVRVSVLGHIQRGGTPTSYDRIIATRFGVKAVELVQEKAFGKMASLHNNKMHSVEIEYAVEKHKTVDKKFYNTFKGFSE